MRSAVTICGFQCENRAVRSAVATGTCDIKTGVPSSAFYKVYEGIAKGHPGLMIQEHAFVEMRGHAGHPQLGIHNDEMVAYHKKAIDMMRELDPQIRICCQLAHAGFAGGKPDKVDINTASAETLAEVINSFKEAARRAKEAGYDCVQIHSAHTYLLSRSISDYYNTRTDEYRPSDFKLLRGVLAAIRTVGIPVGVKLQADDFIEGHTMNAEQTVKIVKALDFDFVELSGGGSSPAKHQTIRPGKDVYYYRHIVAALKQAGLLEKQPVICTGGFENIAQAEEAIQDGCAMVGFGRKWLRNDMFLFNDDQKCLHCNRCIAGLGQCKEAICPQRK